MDIGARELHAPWMADHRGSPSWTRHAGGGSFLLLPRRHALSSWWPQHNWKPLGRSSRNCYQFSLPATSFSRHVAACTAFVCGAQCSMPVRLGHWQSQTSNITTRSNELLARLGIENLDLILKERRPRWYGHVEGSNGAVKTAFDLQLMTQKQLAEKEALGYRPS